MNPEKFFDAINPFLRDPDGLHGEFHPDVKFDPPHTFDPTKPYDPYKEIEDRRVSRWKQFLIENPEELDGLEEELELAANSGSVTCVAPVGGDVVSEDSTRTHKNGARENHSTVSGAPSLAGRQAAGKRPIVEWNEIPDVLSLPAQNIEWVLDGIIPKASITLIAGEPGSYKSWLALCLMRGCIGGGARSEESGGKPPHSQVPGYGRATSNASGAVCAGAHVTRVNTGASVCDSGGVTSSNTCDAALDNADATRSNTGAAADTRVAPGTFLGRRCRVMDVLYLDRENPLSVVRERMAMLGITSLGVGYPGAEKKESPHPEAATTQRCHPGAATTKHCHPEAATTQRCHPEAGLRPKDPLHPLQAEPSITPQHPEARYWGGWLHDSAPGIGDFRLLQAARERHPLIIFDSLIRFHSADENSATEMAAAMQDLRALANAGATVILLHHRAKSETSRYRGSSDIAGGVDLAISVSRDRSAGIIKLDCFKSRFSEEFSMTLRPELHDRGDFVVTDNPEAAPAPTIAEQLWEAIQSTPGKSQSELVEATELPFNKTLATLEEFDGKLWRSERGPRNTRRFFPMDSATQLEIKL
jgi:archaellum biogenesis ATPase FlaH